MVTRAESPSAPISVATLSLTHNNYYSKITMQYNSDFNLHPFMCKRGSDLLNYFKPMNIYTGEDLKRHIAGVPCFKSLPIPHL